METEKRFILELLPKMKEINSELPTIAPDLIKEGTVFKDLVYQSETCEVALLILSPNAKIKRHKHVDDKEYYFNLTSQELKGCIKGHSHELNNDSPYEWMFVLSIKYKC